jgi:hypothetical protein
MLDRRLTHGDETSVRQETDLAYYRRRADEELEAAQEAASEAARASHVQLSTQYSILADMIRDELGRRRLGANDNP